MSEREITKGKNATGNTGALRSDGLEKQGVSYPRGTLQVSAWARVLMA